jgi:hypothetical protein
MATRTPPPIGHNSGGHNSGHREVNDFTDLDFSNPGNWIALSRDVLSHPIVGAGQPVKPYDPKRPAYSRMEAWIDLLALAAYKPGRINNKGQVMTLLVGQLMGARAFLALRWNWTEKTVRGFLDTLETEGMISRVAHSGIKEGQRGATLKSNQCNIVTISNYSKYQFINDAIESYLSTLKGPARGQRRASEGPESNTLTLEQEILPPTPLTGGARPVAPKSKFKADELRLTDEAFALYNAAAERLGFAKVASFTDARRTRLLKRLGDIGGLEPFKVALGAIEHVPFLMGKAPPRQGQAPFKLDLERLLQSQGDGLGDVLARLIDKADQIAAQGEPEPPPRNGKVWGWWRKNAPAIRAMSLDRWREIDAHAKPNGTWPWDVMGPPPGHPECLVPEALIAERGYAEIYRGKIHHS